MSAFQTHFLEKYFAYRGRYVAHIVREAPRRGRLAVLSEIARLGFMLFGCLLCALIFWLLTAGSVQRESGLAVWPVVFGLCAAVPTIFALLTVAGLATAVQALRAYCDPSGIGR